MLQIPDWITDVAMWAVGGVSMLAAGFARMVHSELVGIKTKNYDTSRELEKKYESLDNRVIAIEQTYVSQRDLDGVMNALQTDIQKSFDRSHQRIDELYKTRGGRNG